MEQVSGRAGRKDGLGKVMIQVSNLKHPVLQFVQQHNYHALYQFEMENRQQFHYPPFTRLIQVIFKHKDKHVAEEAANIMQQGLSKQFGAYLNGPSQPIVDRIRNQYIWEILLKLPKDSHLVNNCKRAIHQQMVIIQTNKRYRLVHIIPNADPIY
jgi:primosomal protein N' (replication factor Y)